MRYVHYYTQKASVPEEQWADFESKLKLAFNNLPDSSTSAGGMYKDRPLVLCSGTGQQGGQEPVKLFVTGQGDDFEGVLSLPPAVEGVGHRYYPDTQRLFDRFGGALDDDREPKPRPVDDSFENRLVGIPSFYF